MADLIRPQLIGDEFTEYGVLLELLHRRPGWHSDALCKEHPAVDFFPGSVKAAQPALAVCGRCLAKVDCREWAMAQEPNLDGVWGGLTAADRAKLRRERRAA